MKPKPMLLSIGGFDPCAYSGILRDLHVWHDYSVSHRAVATAITAQSEKKILAWEPVSPSLFQKELESVSGPIFGIKISMLATLTHAKILTAWLAKQKVKWTLWDPVLRSSSGMDLLKAKNWNSTLQKLLKQVNIFTPNIPEAEWILQREILNSNQAIESIQKLQSSAKKESKKTKIILLKGGHLPEAEKTKQVKDFFLDGQLRILKSEKRAGDPRGTGCTLGSAILAELYRGREPFQAVRNARKYLVRELFSSRLFS